TLPLLRLPFCLAKSMLLRQRRPQAIALKPVCIGEAANVAAFCHEQSPDVKIAELHELGGPGVSLSVALARLFVVLQLERSEPRPPRSGLRILCRRGVLHEQTRPRIRPQVAGVLR